MFNSGPADWAVWLIERDSTAWRRLLAVSSPKLCAINSVLLGRSSRNTGPSLVLTRVARSDGQAAAEEQAAGTQGLSSLTPMRLANDFWYSSMKRCAAPAVFHRDT